MINFNIINKCHTLLVTYTMLVWICWFQSLLDAQPQPGRSYKIGSGRPSILPSVHTFSRDWLISFLWNLAWCYGPIYSFVWLSWIFLKKSPLGKNDQKWLKNIVFGLFKKIMSIIFMCAYLGKIWFSSYSQKRLSANEISVFFNHQYFTIRLISDFDFWHVHRHEWKKQGSLTGFLEKSSFGEMGHFGPKNCVS